MSEFKNPCLVSAYRFKPKVNTDTTLTSIYEGDNEKISKTAAVGKNFKPGIAIPVVKSDGLAPALWDPQ